jgi:hypothetical protein
MSTTTKIPAHGVFTRDGNVEHGRISASLNIGGDVTLMIYERTIGQPRRFDVAALGIPAPVARALAAKLTELADYSERTPMSTTMNPKTDTLYNEQGKKGQANGLFMIERGQYTVVLLAEKRWGTPTGRKRSRRVMDVVTGATARDLARNLLAKGWAPPRGLRKLCESAPGARIKRRGSRAR